MFVFVLVSKVPHISSLRMSEKVPIQLSDLGQNVLDSLNQACQANLIESALDFSQVEIEKG